MQYVGHFSFGKSPMDTHSVTENEWHGHFTLVEDARDVEDAIAKFTKLIKKLHKGSIPFDKGTEIYMEACVEIQKMPHDGMLTFYSSKRGAVPDGVYLNTSAHGASKGEAISYYYGEEDDEDGKPHELIPLIILDAPAIKRNVNHRGK